MRLHEAREVADVVAGSIGEGELHKWAKLRTRHGMSGGSRIFRITMRHLLSIVAVYLLVSCQQEERVSFNAEVRPIFNTHCVGCHGGVKQSGELGLIFREDAMAAIEPGSARRSELVKRIRHTDLELRMPYERAPLSEADVQTLERWIDQGAEWEEHWAYQTPTVVAAHAAVPAGGNEIDAYVTDGLAPHSLSPAPAAPPHTLIRRLAFDLTGLPPTPEEVAAFVADPSEAAYAAAVDRYLDSPRYGEHRAATWLDLARYADSRGYERDRPRTIWPYRDWVIRAFNVDMPFDSFTILQLAGDLLEQPTREHLIATAFHRNTPSNGEGGTDNEEYRVVGVLDRVNTTWEVWQGTSMACVQCHSHPYDPIEHAAYYRSYAYFNNTADHDHVWERPLVSIPTEALRAKVDSVQSWVTAHGDPEEIARWQRYLQTREPVLRPYHFEQVVGGVFTDRADEDFLILQDGHSFALPPMSLDGVTALHLRAGTRDATSLEVHLDAPDGPVVASANLTQNWGMVSIIPLTPTTGEHQLYFRVAGKPGVPLLNVYSVYLQRSLPGTDAPGYAEVNQSLAEVFTSADSVAVPVLSENPPELRRTTHLFERGNWLVHGAEVRGGVPEILPDIAPDGDRLTFARWLVSPENPLTARVAVNRVWTEFFGRGIVSTPEDFGSQGTAPSHPKLLDWLAVHFATELDWSVKELIRTIVLSRTYRQTSQASLALRELDPYNTLLARGPSARLTAEQLRDQMLAVSGLLSDKMYGPGVMPPQPKGLWDHIPYSDIRWKTSTGEDRYRRAVYTYLRRSVLYPGMTTFDGSAREVCLSQRIPTNTPLQALATLNDPAFIEGMRTLAQDVDAQTADPATAIDLLHRRLLQRPVREGDRESLLALYEDALAEYDGKREEALFLVVNVLFNLDEFLTKS